MIRIFKLIRPHGWLIIILIIATILRFKDLVIQSLWLDELHLMIEADPSISWKAMFKYLEYSDLQPPLFFIIERCAFSLFGYHEFVARAVTATAGVISVGAMYLLGREMLHKRLGLLCALLTCFNYYNIYYAQDARPYIFSFLFAALSFTFILRVLKNPTTRNGLWYCLWTLSFLYTHYFSLFVLVAQTIIVLIFIFQEKGVARKALIKSFIINVAIIIAGYTFWIPVVMRIKQAEETWIPLPAASFLQNYFMDYFGNDDLLQPLLLFLLATFVVSVAFYSNRNPQAKLKDSSLLRCFFVVFIWIFVSYLVPYFRSLQFSPLLYPRYTIVVLPAFLLILAYALELFKSPVLRYTILSCVICISMINLFMVKKYYSEVHKTQFREMSEFLVQSNKKNYPVINELTQWQQGYYLHKLHSKAEVWTGKKELVMDSIRMKSLKKFDVEGFWIVGAHGDKKPDSIVVQSMQIQYDITIQKNFYDAWAMQFVRKKIEAER